MGYRRPISAILAVFGGLEIGLRCAGYAGWVCIWSIYDLRRSLGYLLSPQKSVKRIFCRQKVGRSGFRVRHDAGVFRPNGRHQRNANGEKTLKPRSFGVWGGRTEKVEATSLNQRPAKCAISTPPLLTFNHPRNPTPHAALPRPRSRPEPHLEPLLTPGRHRTTRQLRAKRVPTSRTGLAARWQKRPDTRVKMFLIFLPLRPQLA